MLLVHWARRAASRADCTAGNKQRDQNGDDGDHDQQLDQRETATVWSRRGSAGIVETLSSLRWSEMIRNETYERTRTESRLRKKQAMKSTSTSETQDTLRSRTYERGEETEDGTARPAID